MSCTPSCNLQELLACCLLLLNSVRQKQLKYVLVFGHELAAYPSRRDFRIDNLKPKRPRAHESPSLRNQAKWTVGAIDGPSASVAFVKAGLWALVNQDTGTGAV